MAVTVRELAAALQRLPQDMPIYKMDSQYGPLTVNYPWVAPIGKVLI